MQAGARLQTAIEILDKILTTTTPADQIMTHSFRNQRFIGSGDRRFIADLIYQSLRKRMLLEWVIEKVGGAPTPRLLILTLLTALEHQKDETLERHFSGEHYHPHALSELEKILIEKIRNLDLATAPRAAQLNIPEWLLPLFEEVFPNSVAAEINAMNEPAGLDLRVNTLKANRPTIQRKLKSKDIIAQETALSPIGLRLNSRRPLGDDPLWQDGLIEVQDEGSQLVSLLCGARSGMTVMDYCAGAGGKALAMAATMENKGRLIACDTAEWRLDRSKQRFRRAGVHNIECRTLDDSSHKWLKRLHGKIDRLLLDVPCSGTGTWRRNPDLKWRLTPQTLEEVGESQRDILTRTAPLVKDGGRLIYATCSVLAQENEHQIEWFLKENPNFHIIPVGDIWREVFGNDCPVDGDYLRLSPAQHHTDGFFAAILEKRVNVAEMSE